jgi:hypothetical protein
VREISHWSGKTSSPLPDHQTSSLVQPGCTFQARVSVCVTRQSCFALRSLVVHPGCTNATAPACNLYWPSVGPGTHRIVKCRFNPRVVQPVCTDARYAPGCAITLCKRIQGNRAFCVCHIFALSSPTIQQASRVGQESFASIAAIHRAEGCALVVRVAIKNRWRSICFPLQAHTQRESHNRQLIRRAVFLAIAFYKAVTSFFNDDSCGRRNSETDSST